MFFAGIADEAGRPIARQIAAHQELGWTEIELRMVGSANLTDVDDATFEATLEAVGAAGLHVCCFASQLANWSRPITTDFAVDVAELTRAIPRMQRMGTTYIRCMSYPNADWAGDAWRDEAVRRLRELSRMAEDGGVILAHENCNGWGGESPANTLELLERVDSPAFRLVFDTGNPVSYGQNSWEYYQAVYDSIVYVHIKDIRKVNGEDHYVYCGEGDGCVREIVGDLLANGYDGGLSIEPHLAAIIHTGERTTSEEKLYSTYTEYGRRLMQIVEEVRP